MKRKARKRWDRRKKLISKKVSRMIKMLARQAEQAAQPAPVTSKPKPRRDRSQRGPASTAFPSNDRYGSRIRNGY
jgi:hypothetical protein